MHKYLIIFAFCVFFYAGATVPPLSEKARISLLTCSPSDDNVYTLYGHTAIRVCDSVAGFDMVFNYGIFDFSKPYFIYRFAKGETDYMLRAYSFRNFLYEYSMRGSEVCEQVMALKADEREALWQALALNERPENRVYRYNFFFDNCATRPAVMIEKHINGGINFAQPVKSQTFRDIINYCTRNHPWVTFGCDIVVGLPADRQMTLRESFFIPAILRSAFSTATVGNAPLVLQTTILSPAAQTESFTSTLTSPVVCSWLFFAIVLILCLLKKKFIVPVVFLLAGLAGCVLFFLSFFSVHPAIFPNINLLWLHPLHLVGAVLMCVGKKAARIYHIFNLLAIITMLILYPLVGQHFNFAFIPLIATLLSITNYELKITNYELKITNILK
ncbi:MAG: DUF4105 domain-containing protein [Tannerella sp.]|nr:DUF4105 domain-containing protein [Tannerella sp.]